MTRIAISSRTQPVNLAKKRNTAQSASRDRVVTSLSYRGTNVCMQVQHACALKCNTAYAIMWETCEPLTCLRVRCFLYLGGAIFFFVAVLVGGCKYRLCARVNAHTRSHAFIYLVINDVFPAMKGGTKMRMHIQTNMRIILSIAVSN